MTGMGLSRFAKKNDLNVIGFIDQDPSLLGSQINGTEIYNASSIASFKEKYPNLMIVIAVALKEDEITKSLNEMNFSEEDYLCYSKYCGNFPTIDIVGSCNLKCPSCAHGMEGTSSVPMGIMKFDDFKEVINKMLYELDIVSHVSLYSWGEPFLHPQLDVFINYLHELGISVAVSSNLSIISQKQIEKVIKAGPDYLKVSLSGYYPEVYNTTHTGGDINLVKSNMYKIRYYMDKFKVSTLVDVNYHLYTNNVGQDYKKMKELCDELGYGLSSAYSLVMPIERCVDYFEGKRDETTDSLRDLLLVNIEEGIEATKEFQNTPCRFLSNQLNINWDKTVPLCCITWERGDSIVSNDYTKEPLENILAKQKHHPTCEKCVHYGIPHYQLGLNKDKWKEIAIEKVKSKGLEDFYHES